MGKHHNHTIAYAAKVHAISDQDKIGGQELKIGNIVHYVLQSGINKGEHRPAIIVRVWTLHSPDMVNLQVFTDSSNDFGAHQNGGNGILWATSVHFSDTHEEHTWHWPE